MALPDSIAEADASLRKHIVPDNVRASIAREVTGVVLCAVGVSVATWGIDTVYGPGYALIFLGACIIVAGFACLWEDK